MLFFLLVTSRITVSLPILTIKTFRHYRVNFLIIVRDNQIMSHVDGEDLTLNISILSPVTMYQYDGLRLNIMQNIVQ